MINADADRMMRAVAPLAAVADGMPIEILSDGEFITLTAVNEAHVHIIRASVRAEAEKAKLCAAPEMIVNALRDMAGGGMLSVSYDPDARKVCLEGEHGKRSFKTIFKGRDIKIPELHEMEAGQVSLGFLQHIPMLSRIDGTVAVSTDNNKIFIETAGDLEEGIHWAPIGISSRTRNEYPAGLLSDLIGKIRLDRTKDDEDRPSITVRLADDYPMKLEWTADGVGFEYYIAPRIRA